MRRTEVLRYFKACRRPQPGHISPGLGDVKLQKLERRQILAFQRKLAQKKISLRTCNNIFKILKIVLNDAVAAFSIPQIHPENHKQRQTGIKHPLLD